MRWCTGLSPILDHVSELKAGKLDMSLSPQQYLRQTQGPQGTGLAQCRYLSFSYTFLGFNLEHPF